MEQKEFSIKNLPSYTFRCANITAIQFLSLRTTVDLDSINQTEETFNFILEHLEVKVGEKWIPVKAKNIDLLTPYELNENLLALQELTNYFFNEIMGPLFTKSKELSQKQQ